MYNFLQEIPSTIANLNVLRVLNLSHNQIKIIPPLNSLLSLEELCLDWNDISNIAAGTFDQLQRLRHVALNGNNLSSIPDDIFQIYALEQLHMRENRIEVVPTAIKGLTYLHTLDVSLNQIHSIAPEICNLTKLTRLTIFSNIISNYPECAMLSVPTKKLLLNNNRIQKLEWVEPKKGYENVSSAVTRLDLDKNLLITLEVGGVKKRGKQKGIEVGDDTKEEERNLGEGVEEYGINLWTKMTNLTYLSVVSNGLFSIGENVFGPHLSSLTTLDLSNNCLIRLHPSLQYLTRLDTLDVSRNRLQDSPELDELFTNLSLLEELNLSSNELARVPPSLSYLTSLRRLNLSNNQLKEIPDSIVSQWTAMQHGNGGDDQLRYLRLSYNNFMDFPKCLLKLGYLDELHMAGNFIKAIPNEISEMKRLSFISFANNQWPAPLLLPPGIAKLPRLGRLYLRGTTTILPNKTAGLRASLHEMDISTEITDETFQRKKTKQLETLSVSKFQGTEQEKGKKYDILKAAVDARVLSMQCPLPFGVAKMSSKKNEDTFAVHFNLCQNEDWTMYCIFDGHAGKEVSRTLAMRMTTVVEDEMRLYREEIHLACLREDMVDLHKVTSQLLIAAFENMSLILEESRNAHSSGSTAIVVLILGKYIISANCGDARAVIGSAEGSLRLSYDHTAQERDELKRVVQVGGRVLLDGLGGRKNRVTMDGNMEIAVTRSFGDWLLSPAIVHTPHVAVYDLYQVSTSHSLSFTSQFIFLVFCPKPSVLFCPIPSVLFCPIPSVLFCPIPSVLFCPVPSVLFCPIPSVLFCLILSVLASIISNSLFFPIYSCLSLYNTP